MTVARFNHPNIVGLYDIQESPEVAFLTMEYVDGSNLEHLLQVRERLTAEETIPVALAIARGLAAAHGRDVVHHDIKPANVLLARDGTVKVVDFGISQVVSSLAATPDSLFGTPGFIPPESLHGEPYGPRGDLFAFGVTLYRMLTGAMPFSGTSVQQVLRQTLTVAVTPPGRQCADIPEALDSLVVSLLEKDPQRRCPSAETAVRELERLATELGLDSASVPLGCELESEPEPTVRMSHSRLLEPPESAGSPAAIRDAGAPLA